MSETWQQDAMTITDFINGLKTYAEGISIIYAEDDVSISAQVENFLQKFFSDVRVFEDGATALDAYNQRSCDILVTDVMMPNMDGIELVSQIIKQNQEQKVIVVSAYNESEYLMKLINLGVYRFLLKPFDNRLFLRALYTLCKELYDKKEKIRLANELRQNLETTQAILDAMEDALIIIQGSKVIKANSRFLLLSGVVDLDMFYKKNRGRIDSIFVQAKGYLSHCDNDTLLGKLKNGETLKVLVKEKDGIKVMFLRQTRLNKESDLIILTDVTTMEKDLLTSKQKLLTNPFTGIPNKTAFYEKLHDRLEIDSLAVIVASFAEYGQVAKWLGKEKAINVEKYVVTSIKTILETKKSPPFFMANYDQNRYILIIDQKSAPSVVLWLKSLELSYSYSHENNDSLSESIPLTLRIRTIMLDKGDELTKVTGKIEQSFNELL